MKQNSDKRDRSNSFGSIFSLSGSIKSYGSRDNLNGSPLSITFPPLDKASPITLPPLGNASPINLRNETNFLSSSPTSITGSDKQHRSRNNSPVIVSNSSGSSRGASANSWQQVRTGQGRARRNNTSPIYRSSSRSSDSSSNVLPSHTRTSPMTTSNNRNDNTLKPSAQASPSPIYRPIPVRAQRSYSQSFPNIPPYYNAPLVSFPRLYTAAQNINESQSLYLASLIQFVEDGKAVVKHHRHERVMSANELYNCRPSDILIFDKVGSEIILDTIPRNKTCSILDLRYESLNLFILLKTLKHITNLKRNYIIEYIRNKVK